MRKFGKGRVSVKRMNENEKKKKEWKLSSMYIATVAGVATYLSVLLSFLDLIISNQIVIKIIGAVFAVIIVGLLYSTNKQYKKIDEVKNKPRFADILQSVSITGIMGFIFDGLLITPLHESLPGNDYVWVVGFILVVMLLLPVGCTIGIVRQKDWNYREE